MKFNTTKTEKFCLSRNPNQYKLKVNGNTSSREVVEVVQLGFVEVVQRGLSRLSNCREVVQHVERFKHLGVVFKSGGRRNRATDPLIGKTNAVLRAFCNFVVTKWELSFNAKLSAFQSFFRCSPLITITNLG